MEKTYDGDSRFKLTPEFEISFKDANRTKSHINTGIVLGSMNKLEIDHFISDKKLNKIKKINIDTGGYESLDEGD